MLRRFDSVNEREIYEIHGGSAFASSALFIVLEDVSSSDFLFPIDGDTDFILADGDYTFINDYKVLTGATMTVCGDARLIVAEEAMEGPRKNDGKVTLVFYNEFIDKENTGGATYPVLPAAYLKLEKGAQLINRGIFAGTVLTEEANVIGESSAVWTVDTYEADGYYSETIAPYTVTLHHQLAVVCADPDLTCRTGDPALYEEPWRVIWEGEEDIDTVERTVSVDEETGKMYVDVTVSTSADSAMQMSSMLVAVYDAAGRMLQCGMMEVGVVGEGDSVQYVFELDGCENAAVVKAFFVGQGFVPIAELG